MGEGDDRMGTFSKNSLSLVAARLVETDDLAADEKIGVVV